MNCIKLTGYCHTKYGIQFDVISIRRITKSDLDIVRRKISDREFFIPSFGDDTEIILEEINPEYIEGIIRIFGENYNSCSEEDLYDIVMNT